jgi:hypothetical protein
MNAKLTLAEQCGTAGLSSSGGDRQPVPPAKPSHAASFDKALAQTDREARRNAAAILEVLAGARKPSDAAQALGITPMRYYLLEMRAIQGLVKACEPPKLGPKGSPDREVQHLHKQVAKLERDCARYAALARVAQRAVNLSPPPASHKLAAGKKGRRHKPPVRAVKLLARLKSSLQESAPAGAPELSAPQVAATS